MAALIGTPVAIAWAAGANPAGQTVNVPAGTTAVYMFWTYFASANNQGLASVTLNGNAPAQTFEVPTNTTAGGEPACGVAVWYNPVSGNQALDPAWDTTPGDGPNTIVVFVQNSDTTAWRDADGANGEAAAALSVTLDTVSGDLVLKWDSRFDSTAPALSGGWTNALPQANVNSYSSRASFIVASGATQVADAEGESYSGLVAVSIPDAPATGITLAQRHMRPNVLLRM